MFFIHCINNVEIKMGFFIMFMSILSTVLWAPTVRRVYRMVRRYRLTVETEYDNYRRFGGTCFLLLHTGCIVSYVTIYKIFLHFPLSNYLNVDMFVHLILTGGIAYSVMKFLCIYLGYLSVKGRSHGS
jgi:hypothetical protein